MTETTIPEEEIREAWIKKRSAEIYMLLVSIGKLQEAREVMYKVRGLKWAFVYDSPEGAGVDEWKLDEISLEEAQ